jgi:histidinol-phosphate aminotransferase
MSSRDASHNFFAPHIERMAGYVPGEQPRGGRVIKLNTNENPYPPSPRVAQAVAEALIDGRLRRYPDPSGAAFREAAARLNGVEPDMVMAGNGSDDLLTILTRAFARPGDVVLYPTPSYILYRTLCEIQDARGVEIEFDPRWRLDPDRFAHPDAKLAFLANPNSPSGTSLEPEEVAALARALPCPLVVDEAYGDFARWTCMGLVADHPNVIVTRSFSKGYGLAGLRLGYLVARPEIVAGLEKVKDSYNCDTLSIAAATAAIDDQAWLHETAAKILRTRDRLHAGLCDLGFAAVPSQANFVWAPHPTKPVEPLYAALKAQRVLVRYMNYAGWGDGLRITVGTDDQNDACLSLLKSIM